MKKIFLIFLILSTSFIAQAQITYSVKAGVLFPELSDNFMGDGKLSFYPEFTASSKINQRLSFSAGAGIKTIVGEQVDAALKTSSSGIIDENSDSITLSSGSELLTLKSRLFYLSIPLYFSYIFDARYNRSNRYIAFDVGLQPNLNIASSISENLSFSSSKFFVTDFIFGVRVGFTMLRDRELEFGFRYCRALQSLADNGLKSDPIMLIVAMNFNRY